MTDKIQNVANAGGSYPVAVIQLPGIGQIQKILPVDESGLPYPTGLNIGNYDYVSVAYPVATTEVYTFKEGGAGGTTVATVTIVYTDSSKQNLSTVTKA